MAREAAVGMPQSANSSPSWRLRASPRKVSTRTHEVPPAPDTSTWRTPVVAQRHTDRARDAAAGLLRHHRHGELAAQAAQGRVAAAEAAIALGLDQLLRRIQMHAQRVGTDVRHQALQLARSPARPPGRRRCWRATAWWARTRAPGRSRRCPGRAASPAGCRARSRCRSVSATVARSRLTANASPVPPVMPVIRNGARRRLPRNSTPRSRSSTASSGRALWRRSTSSKRRGLARVLHLLVAAELEVRSLAVAQQRAALSLTHGQYPLLAGRCEDRAVRSPPHARRRGCAPQSHRSGQRDAAVAAAGARDFGCGAVLARNANESAQILGHQRNAELGAERVDNVPVAIDRRQAGRVRGCGVDEVGDRGAQLLDEGRTVAPVTVGAGDSAPSSPAWMPLRRSIRRARFVPGGSSRARTAGVAPACGPEMDDAAVDARGHVGATAAAALRRASAPPGLWRISDRGTADRLTSPPAAVN